MPRLRRSRATAWARVPWAIIPLIFGVLVAELPLLAGADPLPTSVAGGLAARGFHDRPALFHPNVGQFGKDVRFAGRVGGAIVLLGEGILQVIQPEAGQQGGPLARSLRLRWQNTSAAMRVEGREASVSKVSYFLGDDPAGWVTNLPTYGRVFVAGLYPGIDLIVYVADGELEFDYLVHPGGRPEEIRWTLDAESPDGEAVEFAISKDGALRTQRFPGFWTVKSPEAYQDRPDGRQNVHACYTQGDGSAWSIAVGDYDRALPLVIDPVLSYSSFHGGGQFDQANAVVSDTANNLYIAGETWSVDLNVTGAVQTYRKSGKDAFLVKIAPDGKTILYSTYFGGNGDDIANSMQVVGDTVYLAGETSSGDLPGTTGSYQSSNRGGKEGFITRIRLAALPSVLGTSYLGGAGSDRVNAIVLDTSGNPYVAGYTASSDFPVSSSFGLAVPGGGSDAFVARLSPDLKSLSWSGIYGGGGGDQAYALALGSGNSLWFAGTTSSSALPVVHALQTALAGPYDCFLARVPDTGATLLYSGFLGGTSSDFCYALTVDGAGNPIVAGSSASVDFPVTPGVFQPVRGGSYDAVAAKLDAYSNTLTWATYLGGTGSDSVATAYLDTDGAVCLAGNTQSSNFPTMDPVQPTMGGLVDGFLSCLNSNATALPFSTYLGGAEEDRILGVVRRTDAWTVAVGLTQSGNFPITANARQPLRPGAGDGFVTAISRSGANLAPVNVSVTPSNGSAEVAELTYLVEDGNGYQDVRFFFGLIHNVVSPVGGCYFRYEQDTGLLSLLNDAGNAWLGSVRMGEAATLTNSKCSIDMSRSSVWGHATRLSVRLRIAFRAGFGGPKSLLMYTQDRANVVAGWQLRGGWTVPQLAGNLQPSVTYFQPNSGTFPSTAFVMRVVDANGATDLKEVHLLANSSLSYPNSCYVLFNQQTNQLRLLNDQTTVFLGPLTPGVSGTLENSRCILAAGYSSATRSGDSLTLALHLTFKDAAAGANSLWTLVSDQSAVFLGWQSQGSFTVPIGPTYARPTTQSIDVETVGTKLRFTLTGADANGGEDIKDFYFLGNGTLTNPGGCYVLIRRLSQQVLLLNDVGTAWQGSGTIGDTQVIENSQCQIDLAEVSTSVLGTTATAVMDVQFKVPFTGQKSAWLYVEDAAKLASGWALLNTFVPTAP